MKDCGPVPGECLTLIVPLGNLNVSVVLLVVMSTPPAVNTPRAITVVLAPVGSVDMAWKRSMPEAPLLLEVVDLDHGAVGVVLEPVPLPLEAPAVGDHGVGGK